MIDWYFGKHWVTKYFSLLSINPCCLYSTISLRLKCHHFIFPFKHITFWVQCTWGCNYNKNTARSSGKLESTRWQNIVICSLFARIVYTALFLCGGNVTISFLLLNIYDFPFSALEDANLIIIRHSRQVCLWKHSGK